MEHYKELFNKPQNGFYPHYGGDSIRRHSNEYKEGKMKGRINKESKLERDAKFKGTFSAHNKRKNEPGYY